MLLRSMPPRTRRVACLVLGPHAYWMLIGACDPNAVAISRRSSGIHSPRGACGALALPTLAALGFREARLSDLSAVGTGGDADSGALAPPIMTWVDRHTARAYEGAAGVGGIILRQIPSVWLDALDDKRTMHRLLTEPPLPPDADLRAGGLDLPSSPELPSNSVGRAPRCCVWLSW